MKRTEEVGGVFPSLSTAAFLVEVDRPSKPVIRKNTTVLVLAAAQTVHHKTGPDKLPWFWFIVKKLVAVVLVFKLLSTEHRECVCVDVIDRDVHLVCKNRGMR